MRLLESLRRNLRTRLAWKLMISYLLVILVGVITLTLATEAAIPTAFNRHMLNMQAMMRGPGMFGGVEVLENDLFTNFRAAVTEALLVSAAAALVSAIFVSVFISRRVATPIYQIMQASQRIAAGRYQERVDVFGEDEVGQLARSFNQMAATLEQTETMRRDLIGNVAHELRTPLTTIKGYMEGLIDGVLPPEAETYQQVYQEADRLQRLVSDLQELSRVEAGAFQLDRRPVSVVAVIDQAAARLRPQFEEKGIQLRLDLPLDLPPVLADKDRLSQVLFNFIGNALQYTDSGGRVSVTAYRAASGEDDAGAQVFVVVKDTGVGISAEHLSHLFTRFYRVDKSRSRAGGGSGVGLTIVKHLIEAHGGRVWVESEGPGQGSVFGFSLPPAD